MGWFTKKTKKQTMATDVGMTQLLSSMRKIEPPVKKGMKIQCPVCNEQTHVEDSVDGDATHWMIEPYPEKCPHLSAEVNIFDYELENKPLDYYESEEWENSDDWDKIYHTLYVFSAEFYLPYLRKGSSETPDDFREFLKERNPDYYIKVKAKDMDNWHYFFYTSGGFGKFDAPDK